MLLLSCSGYSYCQIKALGPVSWQTYQSSSHAITVRNILPCCFMCNCRKIVIAEGSQKNQPCCCWQVCERSGTKPKAIKNSVRGHAKHDGKLQQWGQQSRRPVFQFIRHPPHSHSHLLAPASRQSQTPLLRFSHTRLKQTGWRGVAVSRHSLPEQEELWDR